MSIKSIRDIRTKAREMTDYELIDILHNISKELNDIIWKDKLTKKDRNKERKLNIYLYIYEEELDTRR